jgi:predicted CXXCH cytochrome family protein
MVLFVIGSCNQNHVMLVADSEFVGSKTCIECHETEYELWKHSDHDNAMDTAISSTVLGDFNNAEFERNGFVSRFYKKNGSFYVFTKGPGGIPGDFQIAYTFGVRPLQQYLIPFEKGRLQCLQIAWDTENNRWYHLADSVYKNQEILPDDWLYWTNNAQNWNGMCAECHSTNLNKNYNPKTKEYNTTWSEIDVSCEACHGPGSVHNQWAEIDENKRTDIDNYGLKVQTSNITSNQQVDQCAYCHSRRSSFDDFVHPRDQLFDIISPQLPMDPYYFADGQILEEDYVYGSFTQSKMHRKNVRCTFCHDAHSLKLKFDGNKLCYQCHNQEVYGSKSHHFHKEKHEDGEPLVLDNGRRIIGVGEGTQCISCHMPGRFFMGVDFRRDHSMRIPRPDLSEELGTPNACNQCHSDKESQWAAAYTEKWYGKSDRGHFGETMHLAAKNDTLAIPGLIKLIDDENSSELIRATATHYIGSMASDTITEIINNLIYDEDALVRREAVRNYTTTNIEELKSAMLPLLGDSVRMVRMEAAYKLSVVEFSEFDSISLINLKYAISEYIDAMEYSADFSSSRHNLGNLYSNIQQYEEATENYLEAIRIDNKFYPAKVNLAMLYNRINRNEEAQKLLIEVIDEHPDMGEVCYSLGLLQAEMGNYETSIKNLNKAAELLPESSRIWFNLFRMYEFMKDSVKASLAIDKCLILEPKNLEYLYAKIEFLVMQNKKKEAVEVAKKVLRYYPNIPDRQKLLNFIQTQN